MRLESSVFVPEFSERERYLSRHGARRHSSSALGIKSQPTSAPSDFQPTNHAGEKRISRHGRYVSDVSRFFFFGASVTLHLVCVQAIDSNANNLVSRRSTCTCRPEYLPALLFLSRISSSREILSGRQPVHTSHTSVWRYARDIEISLHRKFVCGIRTTAEVPRVSSNRFLARHREPSFRTQKAITVPQWPRQNAVSDRAVCRETFI